MSRIYEFNSNVFGSPISCYTHPEYRVSSFYIRSSVSPDDLFLSSGSSDHHAYLWKLDNRYPKDRIREGHKSVVGEKNEKDTEEDKENETIHSSASSEKCEKGESPVHDDVIEYQSLVRLEGHIAEVAGAVFHSRIGEKVWCILSPRHAVWLS